MLRLSALIAIVLLTSFPAQAQSPVPCLERDKMLHALATTHDEKLIMRGLSPGPTIFELLINHETKTWSVLITNANRMSCLVGAGTAIKFLGKGGCYPLSKDVKSNLGYKSASFDQTSYRQMCAQGSSHMDTARARSGDPPLPR